MMAATVTLGFQRKLMVKLGVKEQCYDDNL
jgi:hypothetical protein